MPSGHTEGSTSEGMKKEQRFCESCVRSRVGGRARVRVRGRVRIRV